MSKFVFFDTEFCNFSNLYPISIGIIDISLAKSIYLEFNDFNKKDCSDFVIENIIPLLTENEKFSSKEIAIKINEYLKSFNEEVIFIADYVGDKIILENLMKLINKDVKIVNLQNQFKQSLIEQGLFNYKLYENHLSNLVKNIDYFLNLEPNKIHYSIYDAKANALAFNKTINDIKNSWLNLIYLYIF